MVQPAVRDVDLGGRWLAPGLPRHLAADIPQLPARLGFPVLELRWSHAERAASWDISHGDPFDRILAAQSEIENIPLVTRDPAFLEFGTKTLW